MSGWRRHAGHHVSITFHTWRWCCLLLGLSWAAHGSANVKTAPRRSEVQPPPADAILRYRNSLLHSLLLCHFMLISIISQQQQQQQQQLMTKCWTEIFTWHSWLGWRDESNQMKSIRININRSDRGSGCIFSSSLFRFCGLIWRQCK